MSLILRSILRQCREGVKILLLVAPLAALAGTVTYGYDPLSRRTSLTRTNSTSSSWNYDLASRLLSLGQDFSGSTQDLSLGFGYTLASQLSARSSTNSLFDWTAQLPDKTYAVNGLNQYTTVGGATIGHDLNGNLTSDGSRTFAYDVENRLTTVSGSASLTLAYDPLGRLRQSISGGATTELLHDGDRPVAEYTTGGTLLRRYVHGPGVDDPMLWYEGSGTTNKRYLHVDERGTVIATSLSTGVATPYYYGPYGEPTTWPGSRFRYTGQIALPEASLFYYKARVYDPVLGRFLQTDPIGYKDDFNLYAYVYNDPLNKSDPTGEELVFAKGSTDTFKEQFAEIIQYHNKHGTAGTFARVEKRPETVIVKEGTGHDFNYDPASKTMTIDPTSGLEVAPGKVQTPALGALHEAAHAERALSNPTQEQKDFDTPDAQYNSKLERDIIEQVETPAAKKIGEPTRTNHKGQEVRVKCPTCDK